MNSNRKSICNSKSTHKVSITVQSVFCSSFIDSSSSYFLFIYSSVMSSYFFVVTHVLSSTLVGSGTKGTGETGYTHPNHSSR